MSEDCLTLNVVTPEAPAEGPLPVMVFIHGGGYFLGSSATPLYDGAALARRGCVYVSVNYRLGALGCVDFSSLSTPAIPLESNLYLRDLVLALQWVRDNIAEFGGDLDNVTIFGESAGACITATLLAIPAAKGLFAQAISEIPASGLVRSKEVAAEFANRFANLHGVRRQDAANALMQASAAQLVKTQHRLIDEGMPDRLGAFPIGPVVGDDILPTDLVEAMRRGEAHRVPLIVGTNAEEAGCSPGSWPCCRPTNRWSKSCWPTRNRLSANALPPPIRTIPTGPRASSSAVTSPSARRPGRSPRPTARTRPPTSTGTTTPRARCAGRVSAPPTPPSCSPCSTSTAPGSARC